MVERCPVCGGSLEKGLVEASVFPCKIGLFPKVTWTPEGQAGRFLPRGVMDCQPRTEGGFCPGCKKVFAAFDLDM